MIVATFATIIWLSGCLLSWLAFWSCAKGVWAEKDDKLALLGISGLLFGLVFELVFMGGDFVISLWRTPWTL